MSKKQGLQLLCILKLMGISLIDSLLRSVFRKILQQYLARQIRTILEHLQKMSGIVDLLKEAKRDVAKEAIELNIEEFKSALSEVDSQMKNLPATAQVLHR